MGLDLSFKRAKMTILAYRDAARSKTLGSFEVQYNPETLKRHHSNKFAEGAAPGDTSKTGPWVYSPAARLDVALIFDGTRVGAMGLEQLRADARRTVDERVAEFMDACCHIDGDTHEPPFLRIQWGSVVGAVFKGTSATVTKEPPAFDCRLESVEVNYETFGRDGTPLHARLAATFVEDIDPAREAKLKKRSSPDLTHRRMVVAGDTLPLLCREIYGSPLHYLRVAQVNMLEDFRNLTPGQELIFPPFARGEEV